MNANGINAGSAATVPTGGSGSAAAGKTGSADAFAGLLVQAMGGNTDGQSGSSAGIPAGLLGLLGVFGTAQSESMPSDLLQLLDGLAKQLEAWNADAELPEGLQDQLAALLLMLQIPLASSTLGLAENPDDASPSPILASDSEIAGTTQSRLLLQALGQSIRQLTDSVSKGETGQAEADALAEPLKSAIGALQQAAVSGEAQGSKAYSSRIATAKSDASEAQTPSVQTAVQPQASVEIRKASAPLRNPAWSFQAAAAADTEAAEVQSASAPVQTSETSGQNGSAPAWTLFKGDSVTPAPATPAAAPAQVPVQQFAEHIGKFLVKQFVLTQGNGAMEAKISLTPEHLGHVDIKILLQNGQITAQFVTENGVARDMLENQMSQLRTALQGQGLQVDKMEVVQQPSSSDGAAFFQQRHEQQGSGQHGNGSRSRGSRGVYDDSAGFEAELDRTTFLREIGYGSSLNVTA